MAEENPNKEIVESQKDNRERLQKSMREGLLNVKKSVDNLQSTFDKTLKLQKKQLEQSQQDAAFARESMAEASRKTKAEKTAGFFKQKKEGLLAKLSSMGILDAASLANQGKMMSGKGDGGFGVGDAAMGAAGTYGALKGFDKVKALFSKTKGQASKLTGKGSFFQNVKSGIGSGPKGLGVLKKIGRVTPFGILSGFAIDYLDDEAKAGQEMNKRINKVVDGKASMSEEFPELFEGGQLKDTDEAKKLAQKVKERNDINKKYGLTKTTIGETGMTEQTLEQMEKIDKDAGPVEMIGNLTEEENKKTKGIFTKLGELFGGKEKEKEQEEVKKVIEKKKVEQKKEAKKVEQEVQKYWVRTEGGEFLQREGKSKIGDTEFNREMFDSDEEYNTFLKDKEGFYQKSLAIDAAEEKKKPRGESLKPKAKSTSKLMGEEPKKIKTISQAEYDKAKAEVDAYNKRKAEAEKQRDKMMNDATAKLKAGEITDAERDDIWSQAKGLVTEADASKPSFKTMRKVSGVEKGTLNIAGNDVNKMTSAVGEKGKVINKASGAMAGGKGGVNVAAPVVDNSSSTTNNVNNNSNVIVPAGADRGRKSPTDDYRRPPI